MATWSGWRAQLLQAAGLPTGSHNLDFMGRWASHANTDCARNPVDISHKTSSSSNCASLPNGREAQQYGSHGGAANAFAAQLNLTDYPNLREALAGGNPYDQAHADAVALDLQKWGSTKWQAAYIVKTHPPGVHAPKTLRAWNDLRHEVNHEGPKAVRHSHAMIRQALRDLAKVRKVTHK